LDRDADCYPRLALVAAEKGGSFGFPEGAEPVYEPDRAPGEPYLLAGYRGLLAARGGEKLELAGAHQATALS
jgi:hypothetical protein